MKSELEFAHEIGRKYADAFSVNPAEYLLAKQRIDAEIAGHPLAKGMFNSADGFYERLLAVPVQKEMLWAG